MKKFFAGGVGLPHPPSRENPVNSCLLTLFYFFHLDLSRFANIYVFAKKFFYFERSHETFTSCK